MEIVLAVLFFGLILGGLNEIIRRNKLFSFALFTVIPLILTPIWLNNSFMGWFDWTKIYSVMVGIIFILVFRFTKFHQKDWVKYTIYLLFSINILEAVIKDILELSVPHVINSLAGIILILALPKPTNLSINSTTKTRDLNWKGMDLGWVIGYTIWNWTFVYLNFVQVSAIHLALLLTPLIVSFRKTAGWLQVRAFTLGSYLLFAYTFNNYMLNFSTAHWENAIFGMVMASISSLFALSYYFFLHKKDIFSWLNNLNKTKK